jgi:hypothetical protein
VSPTSIPLLFGHGFGVYPTPGGKLVLLLLRLSENLFDKPPHRSRTKDFPNLPQMQNFGLGSRTHSPGFAKV